MENHFNHIKWPPLNVTIFITHVRNLCNGCYTNVIVSGKYAMMHAHQSLVLGINSQHFLTVKEASEEYSMKHWITQNASS